MSGLRRSNQPKCECGKEIVEGSVFCSYCKAAIERENAKTLVGENNTYQKLLLGLK